MLGRMALPSSSAAPYSGLSGLWIDVQAWAIRRLQSLRRSETASHLETGILGEREALFFLRRSGYTIVARRWKTAKLRGDIDLIAWDGPMLCFVEIKTRSHRDAFPAELAVDEDKQRTLQRLARAYLHRLPSAARQAAVRFDVLSVYLANHSVDPTTPEFILNQGAFEWR
jgi:putative endonuclease